MFPAYFIAVFRSLARAKGYSAINMLGLAAGLSSFIIILLYLNYELSYDKWSAELKKLYRVSLMENDNVFQTTPAPLAAFLAANYPGVEAATSIQPAGDFEVLLASNDKKIYQKDVVTVDSLFLKVFPYQLVQGNAASALNQPNAAVLSEALTKKIIWEPGSDRKNGQGI